MSENFHEEIHLLRPPPPPPPQAGPPSIPPVTVRHRRGLMQCRRAVSGQGRRRRGEMRSVAQPLLPRVPRPACWELVCVPPLLLLQTAPVSIFMSVASHAHTSRFYLKCCHSLPHSARPCPGSGDGDISHTVPWFPFIEQLPRACHPVGLPCPVRAAVMTAGVLPAAVGTAPSRRAPRIINNACGSQCDLHD